MRKSSQIFAFFAVALAVGFMSCKTTEGPKTLSGIVVDASMNNVVIRTDAGDTIDVSTMDADPTKVSGVLIDDSVQIVCFDKDVDGTKVLTASELTVTAHSPYYYIQGTWLAPNPINAAEMQGVTLNQDGTAQSVGMATLQFSAWNLQSPDTLILTSKSIGNGKTLEGVDTFRVAKLNADSLVLAVGNDFVWNFGRKK